MWRLSQDLEARFNVVLYIIEHLCTARLVSLVLYFVVVVRLIQSCMHVLLWHLSLDRTIYHD